MVRRKHASVVGRAIIGCTEVRITYSEAVVPRPITSTVEGGAVMVSLPGKSVAVLRLDR